jgi:hydrogenase maturation protease
VNTQLIEDVASAVLYEGYLLYPYRASAIKNKQRWNFGVLYPRVYAEKQSGADTYTMRTECLARAAAETAPLVRIRFLHLIAQTFDAQDWQGAVERDIILPRVQLSQLMSGLTRQTVAFSSAENQAPIELEIEVAADRLMDDLFKLSVTIANAAAFEGRDRNEALLQSPVSTHTILGLDDGEFVSLLDPPADLRDAAAQCENSGTWPVLVGEEGRRDAMLSSPIILYDYPQIAPESPGALFDGTEIDEILTLRIMTLTDEEKREMGRLDERAREILKRTESISPEQFMKLHGVLRGLRDVPEDASHE